MKTFTQAIGALGLSLSALVLSSNTLAAQKFEIDEDTFVNVGFGIIGVYSDVEDAGDTGTLPDTRLYISGQFNDLIKFEFNTQRSNNVDYKVLDGIVKIEPSQYFNVWLGRFLPPSDRSNFSGPFYLNALDFPFVQQFPFIIAGRDEGIAFWGTDTSGKFKYQVGAFQGEGKDNRDIELNNIVLANVDKPNDDSDLLYTARFTYNFWDAEPGYYNASTYYGEKDILSLGVVYQYQENAAGNGDVTLANGGAALLNLPIGTPVIGLSEPGDFTGFSVDLLAEKTLANGGVATFEGAFYDYDTDNAVNAGSDNDPFGFGPDFEGEGFFTLVSYLLPKGDNSSIGQFQPMVRYLNFDADSGNNRDRWEIGLNYIVDGFNGRAFILYAKDDLDSANDEQRIFRLGIQYQF